ncbi:MarC family protein [Faunimonas sp. B44]|uniref:MarC family protein n=1 Tax=Faunimonas sp. B44 TaxID=3461493 RepID=UPI004043A259
MQEYLSAFVTLFVTIDPPGLAPLFLALTSGMVREERRQIGMRASLIAFGILVLFALAGTAILGLFGITIHAFRTAGGLLLFYIAFEMIFEKRQERHERSAERAVTIDEMRNLSVFPLAIPLIAGPGAISATILLGGTFAEPLRRGALIGIIAVNIALVYAVFLVAERVDRVLGATGRIVLTRLLGIILAALAVQFVADGMLSLARAAH